MVSMSHAERGSRKRAKSKHPYQIAIPRLRRSALARGDLDQPLFQSYCIAKLTPMPNDTQPVLRFDAFEADLRAGELRKHGMRMKLSGQPFQVLVILLQRAGEVVTREELQQALWPADTYVDFDHGLNTAINKVRAALGASGNSPRFVETLSRRGYRFIAPVSRDQVGSTASESIAGERSEE